MLTLKELNDRTYKEILDQSKELIPRIYPQWTDLRAHDPGITFVELYAWLVEMLENYLNNVTMKNYMKFLKLLNVRPELPERAGAYVTFESHSDNVVIPEGTKLFGDGIVFETSNTICMNESKTVKAVHGNTLSKVYYFTGTDEDLSIELDGYLPCFGECEVKVRQGEYWYAWKEKSKAKWKLKGKSKRKLKRESKRKVSMQKREVYEIKTDKITMKTTIVFCKEVSGKYGKDTPNIMVIAYEKDFLDKREFELRKALPNQVVRLDWAINEELIHPGSFTIQVGEWVYGEKTYRWRDYKMVDDFLNSKGSDPHFVFDYQKREIHFGNNENGAVPQGLLGNKMKIISCILGCGSKGNIRENIINTVDGNFLMGGETDKPAKDYEVKIKKQSAAFGGRDGESFDEALKKLLLDMKKQYRAVTEKDYENAVLAIPGLKVARAKALSEFVRGLKNYPYKRATGELTIVAVPYGNEKTPQPNERFIETIREHLETMRLVTTEVHVIPPAYIGIQVKCTVATMPHIKLDEKVVCNVLEEFISPVAVNGFPGWNFGEAVRKGDIISKICALDGVEYVKDMQLYADGDGVRLDESGDILIPPYALVYSEKHQVLITRDE